MLNVFGMTSERYVWRLAVEDAGDRGREEPVDALVELQVRADEQELGERARVERQRDFGRDGLVGSVRSPSRAGGRDAGAAAPASAMTRSASVDPGRGDAGPAQAQGGQPGPRLGRAGRVDLRRR